LAAAVEGKLAYEKSGTAGFSGVGIDSRTVKRGELFICIRGEHNDGHRFVKQALERGVSGVMTDVHFEDNSSLAEQTIVVIVENTHEAMILLAQQYRRKVGAKIIGITGSNGKTTTKEFTYALLKAVEPKSHRSAGNLNNLFGAPIEMGISSKGEMTRLTKIVQPNVAVITNVGPSHLQFLSTVEDVARAKLEMVTTSEKDVPLVINADDETLVREAKKIRSGVVTFGFSNRADFVPAEVQATDWGSRVKIEESEFNINVFGRHHVYNLLAAYAACRTAGYEFTKINTRQIKLSPAPMRGEVIAQGGVTIINDSYNANPESVRAGLEGFRQMPAAGRRILILGDMLELGQRSEKYHRELGNQLGKFEFALAIIVGEWCRFVLEGARQAGVAVTKVRSFRNVDEAGRGIADLIHAGDVIYVKGSRGIGLEKLIDKIGAVGGGR
jgi:UDP-N-acetylmuramoyl-tripeptide--D-alanyl-D-alanine ligase